MCVPCKWVKLTSFRRDDNDSFLKTLFEKGIGHSDRYIIQIPHKVGNLYISPSSSLHEHIKVQVRIMRERYGLRSLKKNAERCVARGDLKEELLDLYPYELYEPVVSHV